VSDVFQEVEEEFRREQMAKLWKKYRLAVVGGAAALIVGVAGYQGWSYWRERQIETSSRGFEIVAEKINAGAGREKEAADDMAKIAANGAAGYPQAARFQEAALRAGLGDVKAAVKLYDTIASGGSGGALFRDYAQLRASLLLSETAPLEEMKKRLEPIGGAKPCGVNDSPWCVQAQEVLAYATWRAGKKDEALKLYAHILALKVAPDKQVAVAADDAQRYISNVTFRRAKEMSALIEAGMTLADIKPAALPIPLPNAGDTLLLPPTPGPEQPGSLLGPDPIQPPTP
jgi:hypothetical protein